MTDTRLTDIALTTLDGKPTTLAELADGAALVVNVASKCGLTPQYSALEKLAQDYGDRGLTVIGVPCNQFMGQEPGTRRGDPDVLLRPPTASRSRCWPRPMSTAPTGTRCTPS